MVLGEEGFGEWGIGKREASPILPQEIEAIQKFNYDYLRVQLELEEEN